MVPLGCLVIIKVEITSPVAPARAEVRQNAANHEASLTATVSPPGRLLDGELFAAPDSVTLTKISDTSWKIEYLADQGMQSVNEHPFVFFVTDRDSGCRAAGGGNAINTWRPGTATTANNFTLAFKGGTSGQAAEAKTWTYQYSSSDDQLTANYELQTIVGGTIKAQSWVEKPVGVSCIGKAHALAGAIVAADSDSGTQKAEVIAEAASSDETMGNLTTTLGLSGGIASGSLSVNVPYTVNVGDDSGPMSGSLSASKTQAGTHSPGGTLNKTLDHASTARVDVFAGVAGWSVNASVTGSTSLNYTMTWSPTF